MENFHDQIPEAVRRIQEYVPVRVAGGAVRDLLLGILPKDWDLASPWEPERVVAALEPHFQVIPTGLKHGTVTVVVDGEPLEVTTLRIDVETDGRHAEVAFTDDWYEDSCRRDLTFNAMFLDSGGNVIDFHGGREDLRNGRVRFVGNPVERMQEDFLRILRAWRFASRLRRIDFDDETLEAMRKCASGLERISGERIWAEMQRVLSGWNPGEVLSRMRDAGVFQHIGLPVNLDVRRIAEVSWHTSNPITRLVAGVMVFESPWNARQVEDTLTHRWKVSSEDRDLARFLLAETNVTVDHTLDNFMRMVFMSGVRKEWVAELAALELKNTEKHRLHNWTPPQLPINGNDLIQMGMKPGPDMGDVLTAIKNRWFLRGFVDDRGQLLGWAEEIVARFCQD